MVQHHSNNYDTMWEPQECSAQLLVKIYEDWSRGSRAALSKSYLAGRLSGMPHHTNHSVYWERQARKRSRVLAAKSRPGDAIVKEQAPVH